MPPIARSKLSAQGHVSVPAEVRRRLGVGPGAVLEWDEDGGNIVVRRAGGYSFEQVHRAVFRKRAPKPRTVDQLKEGIRKYVRKRRARR